MFMIDMNDKTNMAVLIGIASIATYYWLSLKAVRSEDKMKSNKKDDFSKPQDRRGKLRVVLVRHGESQENVVLDPILSGWEKIKKFKLPGWKIFTNLFQLPSVWGRNVDLSENGYEQVKKMKEILGTSKFFETFDPQVIAHSDLLRAKNTCLGLLPLHLKTQKDIQTLECLHEQDPGTSETVMKERFRAFETWLRSLKVERVFVVGHSVYFLKLLKLEQKMANVDVIECTFSLDNQANPWSKPTVLHSLFSRS